MQQHLWRVFLTLGLYCAGYLSPARAQDGSFDTTFASNGRETFSITSANDVAGNIVRETPDGKLLMLGNCDSAACLARLNPDGSLDQTYGPTQFGYYSQSDELGLGVAIRAVDMLVLPDGRAAILGCAQNDYLILLVKSDGTDLDAHGVFPASECAVKFQRQADGMFDVALAATSPGYGVVMAVQRVLSDLSGLDTSFGTKGSATAAFGITGPMGADEPIALVIQPDGKIVVGGYGFSNSGLKLEIARMLSDGHLDDTFGSGNGRIYYPVNTPTDNVVNDLAIDSKQRIVFGGYIVDGGIQHPLIGRLTSAGQFDAAFGTTGLTELPAIGTAFNEVVSVVPSGQNIIVGANVTDAMDDDNFSISELDAEGRLVPSFGTNGTITSTFSPQAFESEPENVIITRRGIVVAGYAKPDNTQFGIARLKYGYIFGDSFE